MPFCSVRLKLVSSSWITENICGAPPASVHAASRSTPSKIPSSTSNHKSLAPQEATGSRCARPRAQRLPVGGGNMRYLDTLPDTCAGGSGQHRCWNLPLSGLMVVKVATAVASSEQCFEIVQRDARPSQYEFQMEALPIQLP